MTTSTLRVGIDVRLAHWPGIGRYIEEIVARMVADYPATEFVLFDNAHGAATLRDYADPGLRQRLQASNVTFVPCAVKPFSLFEPWTLARIVRQSGVHVMHSPYINIPWLDGHTIPLVVTLHDFRHPDLAMQWRSPRTWFKRVYYEVLTRLALHRACMTVCVSEFLAGQLRVFRPALAQRIHVITHAADASFHPVPRAQAGATVAQRLHVPQPYFLFVGTFKPHKNLLAVVRALARLPAAVHLAVAAAPDPRYPEVERAVRQLQLQQRVHFLGHLPKEALPTLYSAATATLLPSDYESFGLPVVESMACATPVIAAPQAALQDVGGEAACYATPNPEALACAMHDVLHHPHPAQLQTASLERAAGFSWARSAAQLHQLYRRAAGRAPNH
jgi:glycosyltransferase involved in cell wall biosynthesis